MVIRKLKRKSNLVFFKYKLLFIYFAVFFLIANIIIYSISQYILNTAFYATI